MKRDRNHAREYDWMDQLEKKVPRLRALMDDVTKAWMNAPARTDEERIVKLRLEDALILLGFHQDRLEEISGELEAEYRKELGLGVAA